jgi:hypothetical protein
LRRRHPEQRPHRHKHQQSDGSNEFSGADSHDANVPLVARARLGAREAADYKVRANSFKTLV